MPDLTQAAAYDFDLPERLIAQHPPAVRGDSRLLLVGKDDLVDSHFSALLDQLSPKDLLVFNNTRVINARLFAAKATGGKVEILVERLLSETEVLAQMRVSKSPAAGSRVSLDSGEEILVRGRQGSFFHLEFAEPVLSVLDRRGHVPLPPYIEHADTAEDKERYQTVFAKQPGAVAAPTAGLHFDDQMMAAISRAGIATAEVTLHVGAGTFQPLRVEDVNEHEMHAEWLEVPETVVQAVAATRQRGGRVIAVGTTVVRALESAAKANGGELASFVGDTQLFLHPAKGKGQFKVVDVLLTNFHLPQSTLLMLVSAFAGYERMMAAYRHAVEQEYRFFSYGDAMLLERTPEA